MLADIVSLVRFAIDEDDELAPFAERVRERFDGWIAMQQTSGREFTNEQRPWLEDMRDHIASSVSMDVGDLELAPFDQRGGLAQAYALFGNDLQPLLDELNEELVA